MKVGKWTALVAAAALVVSVASTALAATVPGNMYGDNQSQSAGMTQNQVQNKLNFYGVKDVDSKNWSAGSIAVAVEAGYLTPSTSGKFEPTKPASTEDVGAAFAKILGFASPNDSKADALNKAVKAGLLSQDEASRASINRLAVGRILVRALSLTIDQNQVREYDDRFQDGYLLSASEKNLVMTLYKTGVMVGYGAGKWGPYDTLTREQLATLIDRLLGASNK